MKITISLALFAALLITAFLSPWASSSPDGLERVAHTLGFADNANSLNQGIMSDYLFPGIGHEGLATAIAGSLGVFIVFSLTWLLGKVLAKPGTGHEK